MIAAPSPCRFAAVPGAASAATKVLHNWELRRLEQLRSPRRRDSFVAGRTAAKALLCGPQDDPRQLAIVSWNQHGRTRMPLVWQAGRLRSGRLSLTHDTRRAAALWSVPDGVIRGIDLCEPEAQLAPSPLYFCRSERERLSRLSPALQKQTAARWFAAKEAAFKTLAAARFEPLRFAVGEHCSPARLTAAPSIFVTQWLVGYARPSLLTVAERHRPAPAPETTWFLILRGETDSAVSLSDEAHHD